MNLLYIDMHSSIHALTATVVDPPILKSIRCMPTIFCMYALLGVAIRAVSAKIILCLYCRKITQSMVTALWSAKVSIVFFICVFSSRMELRIAGLTVMRLHTAHFLGQKLLSNLFFNPLETRPHRGRLHPALISNAFSTVPAAWFICLAAVWTNLTHHTLSNHTFQRGSYQTRFHANVKQPLDSRDRVARADDPKHQMTCDYSTHCGRRSPSIANLTAENDVRSLPQNRAFDARVNESYGRIQPNRKPTQQNARFYGAISSASPPPLQHASPPMPFCHFLCA